MSTEATATGQRLTLRPEIVQRLGYRTVDALVQRLVELPDLPVAEPAGRVEMEARLREPLPEHGNDPELVLETVLRDVLPPGLRVDHPRFFAFVPGPSNPVGVLADTLAAGFSVFAGAWLASPGAAMVETVVLDWLRDICGLPATTAGLFVSGGSMANLTALAVALEERAGIERPRATVYVSDEAHSSVERALRVTGVRHVRVLASDRDQRLVPGELATAVAADRAAGRLPTCVVATAGTTGTGAVDPLGVQLTRQFRALKLWMSLKVYGAAAFRAAVEHGLALAEHAERRLARDPAWQVMTPARLGIVTFRVRRAGASPAGLDALNARLPATALTDGFAYASTHRVNGATALRLCTINPRTTREDVDHTIDRLATIAEGEHTHARIT